MSAVSKYPATHYEFIRKNKEQYPFIDQQVHLAKQLLGNNGTNNRLDEEGLARGVTDWLTTSFVEGGWDGVTWCEIFSMLRYEDFGRQVFALNPIIQEMFENTDISRVGMDELAKLPYGCFYLNLSGCTVEIPDPFTGTHRVSGFYVLRDNTEPEVPKLTFFVHAEGPNGGYGTKFYFSIALRACFERFDSVGDYIKFVVDDPKRDDSSEGIVRHKSEQLETGKMFTRLYRIFAAFLMYMNTEDPSLRQDMVDKQRRMILDRKISRCKSNRKRKKYETQLRRLGASKKTTYVGEREETRIINLCGGSYETDRHWRRGHDHRFWCGPLKNKETGEDWSKVPEGVSTEEFWKGRRQLVTQWLEPSLIRPDREDSNIEHTYRLAVPATYLEKREVLEDMYSAMEGKAQTVTLTTHERSRKNQQACFSHWGFECRICGFTPVKDHPLGEMVQGLPSQGLEAHHLTPLGEDDESHIVSAVDDMRPLCHVCHKVVHARGTSQPPRDVEEMRKMVQEEVDRKATGVRRSKDSTLIPDPSTSP